MIPFSVRKLSSLFLYVYYLKRIQKIWHQNNLEMDLTFENLESDNTAFPLHLTLMNCNIRQEKLWFKYGSSTKQQNYEIFRLEWTSRCPWPNSLESCPDKLWASPKLGAAESLWAACSSIWQHSGWIFPISNCKLPGTCDYWFSY